MNMMLGAKHLAFSFNNQIWIKADQFTEWLKSILLTTRFETFSIRNNNLEGVLQMYNYSTYGTEQP